MRAAPAAALLAGLAITMLRAQVSVRDHATPSVPAGAVRGRVLSPDNGEPVRRARVELMGGVGDRLDPIYTDGEGRYVFSGVPPGRYALSGWKSGYVPTTFGAQRPWEPAAMIAVDPGQTVDGLDLLLARGGSISGRVLDDVGEPLADMQVTVGRAVPANGRIQFQATAEAATTDDRGEFRIGGLPAGAFVVMAFGWAGPSMPNPGSGTAPRPYTTFYPHTPFLGQARAVAVRAGEEITAIDVVFTAETMIMATVSGRVVDPSGQSVQALVSASSSGDGVASAARSLVGGVQAGGEFRLPLQPGDYTLAAQASDMVAIAQVTVDRADVSGLVLALVKGARVTGRVTFDGTTPRPPDGFSVVAPCTDQRQAMDVGPNGRRPARVQPNGSFTLSNLIGTCELRVVPDNRGWRIRSIKAAGRDLLDVPIAFAGGEDLRDVQIALTDRTAELSGTIVGVPPAALTSGVSILVFPDDSRQAARRARWVRPDQNGRFVVADLTPGSYLVALATEVDDLQWRTPAYLDRFRAAAARVGLNDGEQKSITMEWNSPR